MADSDVISKKLKLDTTQMPSHLEGFSLGEFELVDTTAAIYVLDETLYDCAKKLRKFLTKLCVINIYMF